MDVNILTTNTEEDFINAFDGMINKFQIKDKDNFRNELLILIDSLTLTGNNDISKLSDDYFNIIEKYSDVDLVINEALKEREQWQKK